MKKEKGYKVISHTFKGRLIHNDEVYGYTYEITFNKSLEHTGRMQGIEQGLDAYVKKEVKEEFTGSFRNVWYSFINWIKS